MEVRCTQTLHHVLTAAFIARPSGISERSAAAITCSASPRAHAISIHELSAARSDAFTIASMARSFTSRSSARVAAFSDHVTNPARSSRSSSAAAASCTERSSLARAAQLLNALRSSRPDGDRPARQERSRCTVTLSAAPSHHVANACRCSRSTNVRSTDAIVCRSSTRSVHPFHARRSPSPRKAEAADSSRR